MNPKFHIAVQGETLEEICWRVFGNYLCLTSVLDLNKYLAEKDLLDAGDRVILPSQIQTEKVKSISRVGR